MRRAILALLLAVSGILAIPQSAQAHVERPAYWPDPSPDCTVTPCAGGEIPDARSLASALNASLPGDTRVVCKPNSLDLLEDAIDDALENGYHIRPTDHRTFSTTEAQKLRQVNQALFARCDYDEIQPAVTDSGNNDRVVVMPGLYTEPTAAAQPTHDESCAQYRTSSDSGDPGALSHNYQIHCPNDANLIAVIGRGEAQDPNPPRVDRHGVPDAGECIRCNFQIEGSGVSADDVIVEAGDPAAGNGGPSAAGHRKDVGIFIDRADGFVLRNVTVRHAREHAIYMLETDGYLLDRFKTYYAGAYGVLTFVGDHGRTQNCETVGSGDSGLYPGSGAPTLVNRKTDFYPTSRISQEIRWCDSHTNTSGFSGTNSHGTWVHHNNFYNNALGYTTDVFTAAGHPGFPQDGNVVENNNFYSNNFNPFVAGSEVSPFIPAPVGTGLWLAGGNENVVKGNRFYDNWRRGVMLFAVPDATVCGPIFSDGTPVPGCNPLSVSTSYKNKFNGNIMGVAPDGAVKPNGLDFWWDAFPGNTGNCWWGNTAAPGKKVTSSPFLLPGCLNGTMPGLSIGLGNVLNEAELVACLVGMELGEYPHGNPVLCDWSKTPNPPKTSSTGVSTYSMDGAADPDAQQAKFAEICRTAKSSRTCAPYDGTLGALTWLTTVVESLSPKPVVTAAPKTDKPLSLYTCSWWRQADAEDRTEMVQRIRHFVGGAVEGDTRVGFGNVLDDDRAHQMFDDRCSTGYAGAFALYKLYGAAAAFAGANG